MAPRPAGAADPEVESESGARRVCRALDSRSTRVWRWRPRSALAPKVGAPAEAAGISSVAMSATPYRPAPDVSGGARTRRSPHPVGCAAAAAFVSLPWAFAFASGYLTRSHLPIDLRTDNLTWAWSAASSAVVMTAGAIVAAVVAWRTSATTETDFQPRSARIVRLAFRAAVVGVPLWLLLTLWLILPLRGVTLYLDVRDAGAPRDASCEVTRCQGYRCSLTCTRSDGARVRGSFIRATGTPRGVGTFYAQLRRGRFGSWLLVLPSVRYRTAAPEASPGAPRERSPDASATRCRPSDAPRPDGRLIRVSPSPETAGPLWARTGPSCAVALT